MQSFHFLALLRLRSSGFAATLLLLAALGLGSCKKTAEDTPPAPAIKLTTSAAVGNYLTDANGNALYYFGLDVRGSNSCGTPACAPEWPVFAAPALTVGAGLTATDFTTGQTAGGTSQTFYKGWPLYYYAPLVNGQNTREPAGGIIGEGNTGAWYVMRPDYTVMIALGSIVDQNTKQAAFKRYLIDAQGRTLYTFGKDASSPSTQPTNCTGGCATVWSAFYQEKIVAPSSLKASDFGTITRTDGAKVQTTYKGMPLYYFAGDGTTRGKATGNSSAGADPWSVAVVQ